MILLTSVRWFGYGQQHRSSWPIESLIYLFIEDKCTCLHWHSSRTNCDEISIKITFSYFQIGQFIFSPNRKLYLDHLSVGASASNLLLLRRTSFARNVYSNRLRSIFASRLCELFLISCFVWAISSETMLNSRIRTKSPASMIVHSIHWRNLPLRHRWLSLIYPMEIVRFPVLPLLLFIFQTKFTSGAFEVIIESEITIIMAGHIFWHGPPFS